LRASRHPDGIGIAMMIASFARSYNEMPIHPQERPQVAMAEAGCVRHAIPMASVSP
jgi:hypothetical protein